MCGDRACGEEEELSVCKDVAGDNDATCVRAFSWRMMVARSRRWLANVCTLLT